MSQSFLSIDFETRSTVDLSATGAYIYAADPSTDVWCMAWAFDGEEPVIWTPAMPLPERIVAHIASGGELRAWNAAFERVIWRDILTERYGLPGVADRQWVCTMAEASAMALPRALGQAAKVLGLAEQKDSAGADLMRRMARPRSVAADGTLIWWDEPAKLERLYAYCIQDVKAEQAVMRCLRRLTPMEREVYLLDQRMNDRGVRIDRPLVEAAQRMAYIGTTRAAEALQDLTGGQVSKVSQHARLLAWVKAQGVETDSLDKAAVAALNEGSLPPQVRAALAVRSEAGKSSVAKLQTMLTVAGADDRLRGLLFYHGATTGRWAGRLVQPQNFPRGDVPDVESFIPLVLAEDYDLLDAVYAPLRVVSSLLRACLVAGEGQQLLAADYAAIEARVLNWLAGQEDILQLFRDGVDVYVHNAAKLYGIPIAEVQKFPHRQTGKFQELGCGFGMGKKKAVSAAKDVYGLEITLEQAAEIVDGYRTTHAKVKAFWYETENACLDAVRHPGQVSTFGDRGMLKAVKAGGYLYVILPSGRPLCYPSPRIVEAETPWSRQAREDAMALAAVAAEAGLPAPPIPAVETKPSLEFSSQDPVTHQWGRERTYGGKLVENIVQAVARDLMAEAMLRVEAAGYPPILTVHDEIVAEVPATSPDAATVRVFESLLQELPAWATGCPIAAEGWMGPRYRK